MMVTTIRSSGLYLLWLLPIVLAGGRVRSYENRNLEETVSDLIPFKCEFNITLDVGGYANTAGGEDDVWALGRKMEIRSRKDNQAMYGLVLDHAKVITQTIVLNTTAAGRRLQKDRRRINVENDGGTDEGGSFHGFILTRVLADGGRCRECWEDSNDGRRRLFQVDTVAANYFVYKYLKAIHAVTDFLDNAKYMRVEANCDGFKMDGAYDTRGGRRLRETFEQMERNLGDYDDEDDYMM
mmetsp:Transcript_37754/g.53260  ORF Transcript_37754/g.53260 Transcript_37754/m.53260 type:complete len:239 (+) Transcript_37754:44-760(+)